MELRKEAEAAQSRKTATGEDGAKKKKATKKKKKAATKRTKEKAHQRKRLVWAVLSAAMKEEARFPYEERDAAEQKVKQLSEKHKKPFFIQPIKEVITEAAPKPEGVSES
jgi:hypothetical protein